MGLIALNVTVYSQKRIEVLNANVVEFGKGLGTDVKRLIGDVQFKHEEALMYCDSAYLNQKENTLRAFSHVHIVQNDSLNLYGDYLSYSGSSKIARVRNNVRLIHGESNLKTDSLDFDRKTNIGHYFEWGYILDKDNDLKSLEGYYYSDFNDFYAIDSAKLVNPKYIIYSDSLRYNTHTDISYFHGPTDIKSDSNFIYCEYGKYDTKTDLAEITTNAYIISKGKKINGDSIYYDRNKGVGEAIRNVSLRDTSMDMIITGHYACMFEKSDSGYVAEEALWTKYGESDTLFLHADTLLFFTVYDTLDVVEDTVSIVADTLIINDENLSTFIYKSLDDTYQNHFLDSMIYDGARNLMLMDWEIEQVQNQQVNLTDSLDANNYVLDTIRNIIAYNHAQIFSLEIQSRSDSIVYCSRDSIVKLFKSPIIWLEDKQISSEYIEIITEDNKPTEMYIKQSAFIIMQDDSLRFNQISGKDMRAFFNQNQELSKLEVYTDAKSVFFAREEDENATGNNQKGDLVGVNNTESAKLIIYFLDNEPNLITLVKSAKGVLNPVDYIPLEETKLAGFNWCDFIRPKTKGDIFIWRTRE